MTSPATRAQVPDYSLALDRRLVAELSEQQFLDLLGPPLETAPTRPSRRATDHPARRQLTLALPDVAQLATRAPALDRWRRAILATPEKRRPLEVAAAWELTAMECEAAGELDGAITALGKARDALERRRVA